MFTFPKMTSSSDSLSILSNESSMLSSIGSCSSTDVQNYIILHSIVSSQAARRGPDNHYSLSIPSTKGGPTDVQGSSSREVGRPIRCERIRGSQEIPSTKKGNSGS